MTVHLATNVVRYSSMIPFYCCIRDAYAPFQRVKPKLIAIAAQLNDR